MRTNQRRFAGRILPVLLVLCMIISLFPLIPHASAADKLGRFNLISQTEYAVSPGVTERDLLLNSTSGNEQNKGFLMEIDPKNPNVSLKACYKNYDGTAWGMQTSTLQAQAAEAVFKQSDPNANVVGVVNTSFFNMSTGEPNGALVMNGVVYHDTTRGWGYLAILKDGSIEIRDGKTPIGDDVLEATAGCDILVKDGEVPASLNADGSLYPRTAVGIKADGSVLLYVNDGRQAPVSVGMTFRELAAVMRDLGCVDALNLDGGGSTTFMTEREGTGELSIKNSPSDGFERAVSSTLIVVSTAKPSGEFDHASLSPNGEYYTPGTTVPFSALGVDSAGVSVALPEGLTWALEDDTMGSIDANTGVFTANEKTGPVVVQLKQGDKVVGKTTIHVQVPDKLSFLNDTINLKYGQESNLGLTATYQGATLNIKDGDFNWSVENTVGSGLVTLTTDDGKVLSGEGNPAPIEIKYEDNNLAKYSFNIPTAVFDRMDSGVSSHEVVNSLPLSYKPVDKDHTVTLTATVDLKSDGTFTITIPAGVYGNFDNPQQFTYDTEHFVHGTYTFVKNTIGTFDGNTFTSAKNNPSNNLSLTSQVKVTSRWDETVSAKIEVSVGKEPVVILDGGEVDENGNSILGKSYENIAYVHADANGGGLAYETHAQDHGNVVVVHYINGNGSSRGGIASAEQVDIDTGKVRFGEKALRLDYDFRNINGIEGACVGFDSDWEIPGSPTAIGFWCYAPENTPNLWVRIRVRDGSGTIKTMNFTTQSQNVGSDGDDTLLKEWNIGTKGGINWVGWKYIECDLSSVPGPITLLGGETIRIMDTNGGQGDMGRWICQKDDTGTVVYGPTYLGNPDNPKDVSTGHQKGYLYIDNLQLVYGTNNADIDNPVIKSLKAGPALDTAVELAPDGSTVINSNDVTFYSEFEDVQNENTTGLDFGYLYLDGKNMSENENFVANMNDGKLILNAMKLANGTHTVKVLVHDKYGNESVVSRTFTVQGNDESLTSVNLVPHGNTAPLGGEYQIDLTSNKLEDVKAVKVEMTLENAVVSGIDWADDYSGSTYSVENGVLTINAVRADGAQSSGEGTIGAIRLAIPSDLQSGSILTYAVTEGSVTYVGEKDSNVVNTFALPATRVPVTAAYSIELGICYEGADASEVAVKGADGKPAKFVPVYLKNGDDAEKLGVTDKNGILTTDALVKLPAFTVYAQGEDGYSFAVKGTRLPAAGSADGKPYYILENATQNAYSTKSISWMANPAAAEEKAVIEYALKSEYDQTGKLSSSKEGTSLLRGFDDAAALLNNVMITGLETNTEYAYRIGDGESWSDVRTFKTIDNDVDSTTKVFILGDTQTAVGETDNINAINHYLNDENGLNGFTLGIQLGDAVEEPTQYHSWQGFLNAMEINDGAFAHTDMLHVIGNHEQFGDPSAIAANAVFGMDPATTHYSVTYGNVYVATIDFSMAEADVREAAEWLKQDAAASDAPWKILVMHQPPYYTNPEGGSNFVNQILPAAIDEAGIEFVFSGHDHSYARTEPMTGGQVDPDGTYYFICGSTGEKSYPIVNNPDFHFALAQKDYNAIFLGIEATDNRIDINTYDLTPGGAQPYAIIDTVHRTKHQPCAEGEHSWVYRPGRDLLLCEKCLARMDKDDYSGFAKMENTENDQVYMIAGVLQKGWITYDEEMLHAGDDYILHETETHDTRTCTENGHLETVCKTCGETYKGSETFATGHKWDENHVCTVCGKQGIDIATLEGKISSPYYVIKTEGQKIRPMPTVMDGDYELNIKNSTMGRDGYVSWENYDSIGTATVLVDGRGDYYGTLRIDYDLVPDKVTDVQVSGNTEDGATVSWTAVPGAEIYKVYRYDFETKQLVEIASTEDDSTSVVVSGLEPNKAYKICVKACVPGEGKDYESVTYDWIDLKTNQHTHKLTAVAKVDATCTEPGTEAYWKCDECGKLFKDAAGKKPIEAPVVIPAAGHDTEVKNAKNATCTEAGYTGDEVCKVCGEVVKKGEVIPAKGHDVEVKDAKDATCTEAGYTGDEVCKVCGEVLKKGEAIPAKGHTWGDWIVTKEPTEKAKGEETRTCSVCGETETRPVSELAHVHKLTAVDKVDATCIEPGTEAYWKCEGCGKLFADADGKHEIETPAVIPATGHDTEVKNAKNATCTEAGYTGDEVCKVCGEVLKKGEAIPAKGHDVEVKDAKDATCTKAGYTGDEVCKVCGEVLKKGEVIPAKGHSWGDWIVTKEPTEEAEGEETRTCSVCGEKETRSIPALSHVHKLTAVAKVDATCTEPGTEAYWKCEGCGKLFADADATKEIEAPAVITAKGHNWGDWTVTKEATVDAEGEETRTCSVCGEKETRPIDKLEPQKPDKCNGGDDCPSIKLTDVDRTPTSWYHEAVDWAFVKGVTNGTSETTFSPDQACTRAQAVTFLWRANGSPEPTLTKNNFVDVPVDAYYYKAVLWAVENKITNGVDETHFAPEMACSRAHIVTFLYRAAGSPEVQNTKAFSDVPAGEWYANAVAWAAENEITNGVSNDLFAPTKDCTRSEIVTFLYRDEMNKQ